MAKLSINLSGVLLALLPVLASAAELGRITAFLDGQEREWHTISMEQGGQNVATASFEQTANLAELHLQGHPIPAFTSKDVLSIDVRYLGRYRPDDDPMSIEILYMPDGMGGPFWTSQGAVVRPRFRIVSFDVWGSIGRVEAAFDGELCLRPIISSATDPSTCKTVSGKVETDLFAD